MQRVTRDSSTDRGRDPPSLGVSLAFLAGTLGVVGLGYAVVAAPVLVGAFAAGLVTALVVTTVVLSQDGSETTEAPSDPGPSRR